MIPVYSHSNSTAPAAARLRISLLILPALKNIRQNPMASSADKLNLTKLSLNSIVEFILDDSNPLHMRAIRLFELQVAIFYPTSFIPLLENASDTRGIDKRLRTTRIFVATKFLQQIENELCKAARTETISI